VRDDSSVFDDDYTPRQARRGTLAPMLPKEFKALRTGNGVRLLIIDRDRYGDKSGSVQYVFAWTANVDTSTSSGRDAGAANAEGCGQAPSPGKVDQSASCFLGDTKYQSGTFFCWGVDRDGKKSELYLWSQLNTTEILDSTVPADPTHVQISGSGEYVGHDIVEMVSFSCVTPLPPGSFAGVQPFYGDYISIGSIQEGDLRRYSSGIPGGSMQFQVPLSVAKKVGTGSITLTTGSSNVSGTNFFADNVRVGDRLGFAGSIATVQAVISDVLLQLTANWTGPGYTTTDYAIYRKVRVYLVAVSKGGTHRSDITGAPFVDIVFDGSLAIPNAPAAPLATTMGNLIRIEFQQVLGTKIKGYKIYRGTGAGVAFASCSVLDSIPQPKETLLGASSLIQYNDDSFTWFQREQGQVFTYYVTTLSESERNNESAAAHVLTSGAADPSCRLDAPADGGPQIIGSAYNKNLVWNGMLWFNANATVDVTNVNQDTQMGGAVPPAGFNRWDHEESALATPAGFVNSTEIILPFNGVGKYAAARQDFGGWNAAAGSQRIPIGSYLALQVKARTSAGTANGTLRADVAQYNGGAFQGNARWMQRNTDDSISWIDPAVTPWVISASNLLFAHQLYWVIWQLQNGLTTDKVRLRVWYQDSVGPDNVLITQVKLEIGNKITAWTGELVDSKITYPPPTGGAPTPPSRYQDRDGSAIRFIGLQ
jgi:hypothetical protein